MYRAVCISEKEVSRRLISRLLDVRIPSIAVPIARNVPIGRADDGERQHAAGGGRERHLDRRECSKLFVRHFICPKQTTVDDGQDRSDVWTQTVRSQWSNDRSRDAETGLQIWDCD